MRPFRLRVDWTAQHAYPDEMVEVELHVLGEDWVEEEPRVLRRFATPAEAAKWAAQWFRGRGLRFWCDVDRHEREGNTFVVLHAVGGMWVGTGQPAWLDEHDVFHEWPC